MVLELSKLEVEIDVWDPFGVAERLNKSSDPIDQLILVLKKVAEMFRSGEINDGVFLTFLDSLDMELGFDFPEEIEIIFSLVIPHEVDLDDILKRIDDLDLSVL